MHEAISRALEAICIERDDMSYSAAFNAVERIVSEVGESNLAETLFNEIPRTVPFELVAELFDLLAWQTSDNGAAMRRTAEAWLREGKDNRKLLIALHLQVYPFVDAQEMHAVLSRLADSNARVSALCSELIRSRKEMGRATCNRKGNKIASILRGWICKNRDI